MFFLKTLTRIHLKKVKTEESVLGPGIISKRLRYRAGLKK